MRAVRRLHITATRTEDTANRVLTEVASGKYLEVGLPELKPLQPIDIPLTAPAA
ncbi:hypothetical protein [Acidipila rosea]|nr:hypothetical protein [Acidipila rosea]